MAGEDLSPEVRHFIQSTINSVEQLEVLLFLMSNPDREWSAREIGERVRVKSSTVEEKLEELLLHRLLNVRRGTEDCYQYAPNSRALAAEVAESLNQAYKDGKDTITQLIYSRPLDNIRIFADAFRIRRDD